MEGKKTKYNVETYISNRPNKRNTGKKVIAYAFDPKLSQDRFSYLDSCVEPLMIFDSCIDAQLFFRSEVSPRTQTQPSLISNRWEHYIEYINLTNLPISSAENEYYGSIINLHGNKNYYCRNVRNTGDEFSKDKIKYVTFFNVDGYAYRFLK